MEKIQKDCFNNEEHEIVDFNSCGFHTIDSAFKNATGSTLKKHSVVSPRHYMTHQAESWLWKCDIIYWISAKILCNTVYTLVSKRNSGIES